MHSNGRSSEPLSIHAADQHSIATTTNNTATLPTINKFSRAAKLGHHHSSHNYLADLNYNIGGGLGNITASAHNTNYYPNRSNSLFSTAEYHQQKVNTYNYVLISLCITYEKGDEGQ